MAALRSRKCYCNPHHLILARYGGTNKANTDEQLEETNSDGVTFALVETSNGYHLAAMYDAPSNHGDQTEGSAIVDLTLTCNGSTCAAAHVEHLNEGVENASTVTLGWDKNFMGGYAVGPFAVLDDNTACLDHSSLVGLASGARFVTVVNGVHAAYQFADVTELGNLLVCISF